MQTQKIFSKFGELLDSGLGYDVLIKAGEEPNVKEFRVHSAILMAVSPYFRVAFSSTWANRVDGIIYLEKPNISPVVFEKILNFIYKADLNLKQQEVSDICNLIKASDELNIDILNEHILEFFSQESSRLINEDPVETLQITFELDILTHLRSTFLRIICENPEKLTKSEKFYNLDKFILIQIFKRDDLNMEEVKIWNLLLDWAVKEKLDIKEAESWDSTDFTSLKDVLVDFVPHVRWFQIPGKDFWCNIKPFREALPEDLYEDILGYNIDKSIKIKSSVILPKRSKPSTEIPSKGPTGKSHSHMMLKRTPKKTLKAPNNSMPRRVPILYRRVL